MKCSLAEMHSQKWPAPFAPKQMGRFGRPQHNLAQSGKPSREIDARYYPDRTSATVMGHDLLRHNPTPAAKQTSPRRVDSCVTGRFATANVKQKASVRGLVVASACIGRVEYRDILCVALCRGVPSAGRSRGDTNGYSTVFSRVASVGKLSRASRATHFHCSVLWIVGRGANCTGSNSAF